MSVSVFLCLFIILISANQSCAGRKRRLRRRLLKLSPFPSASSSLRVWSPIPDVIFRASISDSHPRAHAAGLDFPENRDLAPPAFASSRIPGRGSV